MGKNILKKVKLFREYLRILKNNKAQLSENFGARVDKVGRIYTVINIPSELIGKNFDIKKSDIDRISSSYIEEYKVTLGTYLNSIGLMELYKEYGTTKVGKYNYLVVIGHSLFRSDIVAKNLLFKILPTILLLGAIFFYFFF